MEWMKTFSNTLNFESTFLKNFAVAMLESKFEI
jgi:hypothetical protein